MKLDSRFATLIGKGSLPGATQLNARIRKEIAELSQADKMGRAWSEENYVGGYTSYASLNNLHHRTPLFSRFSELLQPYAQAFARGQGWNLKGASLEMTDLWMNIMPRGTYHTLHLHPGSVISGAYYVSSPKGSVSIKIEDPRMAFYMNAPLRKDPLYYQIAPKPGTFVLFESWLRHEVPPNRSREPRISLSFNYALR